MRLIYPPPDRETTPIELIESAGLGEAGGTATTGTRPFVYSNFASTINGHATIGGRSGKIGSEADTAILMALRSVADAVLVGAGTVRAEAYGELIPDPELRRRRRDRGLADQPLAVVVSGRMDLPWDAGLFSSGAGPVLIATYSDVEPPETASPVEVLRFEREIDLISLLAQMKADHGIGSLLCEGGPTLHGSLVDAGLIDELFVTFGCALGGGEGPGITQGLPDLKRDLELVWLAEQDGELFSRYRLASQSAS